MNYIILVAGFLFLIKGADYFVEGASNIAKKLHVSPLIIGLTIVSFGTSAPELAVSITASLQGRNDIAVGNVVGSNIFNLLAVIGASAIIISLRVQKSIIAKEFPFAILSAFVLFILAFDTKFQDFQVNSLTRADGLMLLSFFVIFMFYLINVALNSRAAIKEEAGESNIRVGRSVLFSVLGVVGIVLGGNFVVDSASNIARSFGMSENLVGLTIVALGTSLPEFVTSVVAAKKGESDIAIGNVIGSNLFNIFLILGVSSVISPIVINSNIFVDMFFLLLVTLLVYFFSITKQKVTRWEGIVLCLLYIAYMIYIIARN